MDDRTLITLLETELEELRAMTNLTSQMTEQLGKKHDRIVALSDEVERRRAVVKAELKALQEPEPLRRSARIAARR